MTPIIRGRKRLGRWLLATSALATVLIIACGGADAPVVAPTAVPAAAPAAATSEPVAVAEPAASTESMDSGSMTDSGTK